MSDASERYTSVSVAQIDPGVRRVVERLAEAASEQGALAVALTGSHARSEAHAESDIDLHVIGDGSTYELSRVDGLLVSISWATADDHRASFFNPASVGTAVPGWQHAVIIRDRLNVAASLRDRARAWDWSIIGDSVLDAWVVNELTGYAEEVHKLVAAIEHQRPTAAAIQRSILALRLATIMSVHCRLLYDSENGLWDAVNAAMGDDWAIAQRRALGMAGEPLLDTCAAALSMWTLAAGAALPSASERQRAVIDHARSLATSVIAQIVRGH